MQEVHVPRLFAILEELNRPAVISEEQKTEGAVRLLRFALCHSLVERQELADGRFILSRTPFAAGLLERWRSAAMDAALLRIQRDRSPLPGERMPDPAAVKAAQQGIMRQLGLEAA